MSLKRCDPQRTEASLGEESEDSETKGMHESVGRKEGNRGGLHFLSESEQS